MPTDKIILVIVGVALCLLAFVPGRRARLSCFVRGIGMQALIAVPVGVIQFGWVIEGARGSDFPALLTGPFVAVPFNVGGMLCAAAFESIDRAGLMPPRQVTMHAGVYLPLLIAQASLAAGIIAARTKATGRILSDRTILIVLGLVLANSVLGISWPWWGS